MTFEVTIVTLTCARAYVHWKAGFAQREIPLFWHLYRSGIVYFFAMAMIMAFMSATALSPLQDIVVPTQLLSALISSICARMMINIRRVISGDPDKNLSEMRPSDIHFSNFHLTPLPLTSIRDSTRGHLTDIEMDVDVEPETFDSIEESQEPYTPCSTQDKGKQKTSDFTMP